MAKSDRYPELAAFVEKALVSRKVGDPNMVTALGCIVGLMGIGIVGFLLSKVMFVGLAGLLSLVIGFPVLIFALMAIEQRLKAPKTPEQKRKAEVYDALTKFKSPIDRKRIHKELDPVAGELLEACAFYYSKATIALQGPAWTGELGTHRRALRDQIARALEDAMDEAILLSKDCLGKPSKDTWRDKLEDALDLDIVDTVQALTGKRLGDDFRGIYRSPHIPIIFQPLREIAEKLKLLSGEVERMTTEQTMAMGTSSGSASGIDLVIGEMQSLRQAEEELNQQRQGF